MFTKVLIANRGEIACRIIRTLKFMGIKSVAVFSDADIGALHVTLADEAFNIGPSAPSQSYLNEDKILEVAKISGAQAIHPGYGFLSENTGFAKACAKAGIVFIGPTVSQIEDFGLKHTARKLAMESGVPLLPGTGLLNGTEEALREAEKIGYPVMLKSTAGGGGIGLQVCRNPEGLVSAWDTVSRLSQSNFKHTGIYLEKFLEHAKHIEVQIFGDGQGNVIALGERDCSAQRRNQKVIEETPAPGLSPQMRMGLAEAAIQLCQSVKYQSAGTVEFVVQDDFYFLEVNTRLQVEHGVTESVMGVDLVQMMIQQAAGELQPLKELSPTELFENGPPSKGGHSIQARVYAENPRLEFRPSSGILTHVQFPKNARIDTWVETGSEVSSFYDPLLAKIIVHAENRTEALKKLAQAIEETRLDGIETNLEFLAALIQEPSFQKGEITTRFLSHFTYASNSIDILNPGAQTTVQDYPGRIGYWDVGVPPSGPFDALSFRLGNRLLENPSDAAGLEITVSGPTLKFNAPCRIVLTGAILKSELIFPSAQGEEKKSQKLDFWKPIPIPAGAILKLGSIQGPGMRTYLCIERGFNIPFYMGSRSTFTLGKFGGHAGRTLRTGDVLHINSRSTSALSTKLNAPVPDSLPSELIPVLTHTWEIGVLYGPHGSPDYFTSEDIEHFFSASWVVHYNSNRTGIRLIGPKPKWARSDGGEAGLHPSNIHDNAYAIGSIDFTGDMPILLGPDGPSLGGFVCPAVIVHAELWKMGQLNPGDTIKFIRLSLAEASTLEQNQEASINLFKLPFPHPTALSARPKSLGSDVDANVLHHIPAINGFPEIRYRRSGDRNLLIEYGAPVLDLNLRFRVHGLTEYFRKEKIPGVLDLTPGIRSLQIHFDSLIISLNTILAQAVQAEAHLGTIEDMEIPNRIVHLPLSWDDKAIHEVIQKYIQSVRADAPWCPSNIEFIRRINGLDSIESVFQTVFSADYLVMGLGDVYLGAPVATPLDPRHRLVTTKYNPARTWTVENVVGIGGAYMCIYGMEGPGGYQLFGRTSQVWNTYRQTQEFQDQKPWLLRFFDQIRFYPVTGKELLKFREDFIQGRVQLKIEPHVFRLREYNKFLETNKDAIDLFQTKQRMAFGQERQRWNESATTVTESDQTSRTHLNSAEASLPENAIAVDAHISGSIWKILVQVGDRVEADTPLLILESMKMEFTVTSPVAGTVVKIFNQSGTLVTSGQVLIALTGSQNE